MNPNVSEQVGTVRTGANRWELVRKLQNKLTNKSKNQLNTFKRWGKVFGGTIKSCRYLGIEKTIYQACIIAIIKV